MRGLMKRKKFSRQISGEVLGRIAQAFRYEKVMVFALLAYALLKNGAKE